MKFIKYKFSTKWNLPGVRCLMPSKIELRKIKNGVLCLIYDFHKAMHVLSAGMTMEKADEALFENDAAIIDLAEAGFQFHKFLYTEDFGEVEDLIPDMIEQIESELAPL